MAIAGMYAFTGFAWENDGDVTSESWTIELAPANAFAQLSLAQARDFDDGWMQLGITQIRHRPASGPDQTIDLGDVWNAAAKIAYDPSMSSITVAMRVSDWYAEFMLQIFLFG